MKWLGVIAGCAATLALAGCKDSTVAGPATPEQEMKDGHPVVHLPPVETRPFDDGYNAGFDFGKLHATRQTPIPHDDEAQRVAHEQAGDRPERTERWERGFAEGYTDGVRNVVTGQK
jgi:hypothetical protein